MFITIEGIDSSGKSTQAQILYDRLKTSGRDVILVREPGGTKIGERIREILLDSKNKIDPVTEVMLFSAARSQLIREIIDPNLQQGRIVICDRYVDSTTAYQGYGRGVNLDTIRAINDMVLKLVIPDITFVIDISVNKLEERNNSIGKISDRMELSGKDFFNRVRDGFLELTRTDKRFVVIDGEKKIDEISDEVSQIVEELIARTKNVKISTITGER